MEMNFASRGVGAAALTTGIIGTAGTALNLLGNNLGGLFNGVANGCSENMAVNRYELGLQNTITNKDMEIAYLKGRDAAKTDSLELYKYVDGKFSCVEHELCEQKVFNATQIGTISCIQGQVAQLMALTKTVIPAGNVCPAPMPQYNSWTAPTAGT